MERKVESLADLRWLVERRKSVVVPGCCPWNKPKPAAFMIQLSGEILWRLFSRGMYRYDKKESK